MTQRDSDLLTDAALRALDPADPVMTDDQAARAEAALARILSAPPGPSGSAEPESPRRRRRIVVPACLAGIAAVAASSLLVGGGSAFGSWTPTPRPLEADAAARAVTTCRAGMGVPDDGAPFILAERRGDWTYVLLAGSAGDVSCLMENDVVGEDPGAGDVVGGYDPDPPPVERVAPDGIDEISSLFAVREDEVVRLSEGVVGRDVVGVTVHTPTGLVVEASLARGRYAAWWPGGEAKGDNPEIADAPTFTVTLTDGTTRDLGAAG